MSSGAMAGSIRLLGLLADQVSWRLVRRSCAGAYGIDTFRSILCAIWQTSWDGLALITIPTLLPVPQWHYAHPVREHITMM